jgi:glycosyltransferase involved in cell wall biosynthesis
VGNDWERKGGEFLFDIFNEECSEIANLTIVSTDEKVKNLPKMNGVTVINGLPNKDIISLMGQSDVFLFPSWKDELGLVLCEAVSQGLVVMARESGAQGEIVLDGVNGNLFGFSDSAMKWREAILELAKDKEKVERYKNNSLNLAQRKLKSSEFVDKIRRVF